MPKIQYVGRTTDYAGKTLWEIVGNLKNFGIGRLITRGKYLQAYKEPCFYKVVKVEPCQNPEEQKYDKYRKAIVWVERIFRGRRFSKLVEIYSASYKPDYQLIPKDEEELWWKRALEIEPENKKYVKIYDPRITLPPLLKLLIKSKLEAKGETATEEDLTMKLFFNQHRENRARAARKGETPTHRVEYGFGTPTSKSLVENIEAVRKYYDKPPSFPFVARKHSTKNRYHNQNPESVSELTQDLN